MEEENMFKKLVKTLILLIEARNLITDEFFKNKLEDKILYLSENFLKLKMTEKNGDIYSLKSVIERFLDNISSFMENLEELSYLNLLDNNPLLLKAEISLLELKLIALKIINNIDYGKKEIKIESVVGNNYVGRDKMTSTVKGPKEDSELTETKKKILNFVKSYPNSRTKDIIYELNTISGRTVKRNLMDLLKVGFIKKRVDNKAVYYYASD